jgi:hypothetical protein
MIVKAHFLKPMLCHAVREVPERPRWKYDKLTIAVDRPRSRPEDEKRFVQRERNTAAAG